LRPLIAEFFGIVVLMIIGPGTAILASNSMGTLGVALGMIHLATIPVDNTSVNPARSLGTAVFGGSDAMGQLWVFIVFPLVGAAVGYGIWSLVFDETTLPAETA
jgi:aquaporin Z